MGRALSRDLRDRVVAVGADDRVIAEAPEIVPVIV